MGKKSAPKRRAASQAVARGGVLPQTARSTAFTDNQGLAELLREVPGLAYRCRESGAMEFVSDGCLALTGYLPERFLGPGGISLIDLVHPEDRERVARELQCALAAGRAFELTYRLRTAADETKWVCERGRGLYGANGELLGRQGFIAEIGDRVLAAGDQHPRAAQFRRLAELASDWFWEGDAEFRFTRFEGRYVVRRAAAFAPFIGRRPWEADLWIEGAADNERALRALVETQQPFYNAVMYTHVPSSGDRFYMSVSGEPQFDAQGRFLGYLGIGRNVTPQKQAEQFGARLSRMYAALSATNEAILRAQTPDELYLKVCEAAVHGGGLLATGLLLADPGEEWVRIAAFAGTGPDQWRQLHVSVNPERAEGRGLVGSACRTGTPSVTNDLLNDPRMRPWYADAQAMGVASGAAVPLFRGERPMGALLFLSHEKNTFDAEIVRLLQRMGENVSFALENLERAAEQQRAEQAKLHLSKMYAVLSATNEAILRASSPEELYKKVCDAAVHGGKLITAAVLRIAPVEREAHLIVMSGAGSEHWPYMRICIDPDVPEGRGLVGTAYRTGRPAITNDYLNDDRLRPWRERGREIGFRAGAAIPLRQAEQVTGVLVFYSGETNAFDDDIVKLLERMAENVTFALANFERAAEQQRASQALRESEARFKSLAELASDWYWEQDEEYRFTRFEGRYVKRSKGAFERLIGKRPWEVGFEMADGESANEAHRALLESRKPFYDVVLYKTLAGGWRTCMSVSGEPVFDAQGNFRGYRGTGRDITARVRAEAEMRKLSSAIQQTGDSVIITDRDGVIEYVNAAFERTTGYSAAEAIGRRPSIVKSGAHDQAFFEKLWRTVLAGETFSDVFINRRKDGELYYEEKTISPLRDRHGRITHFIATGKDITERMQAQERLQHIAHHDALTGLPNRVLFLDRLEQALLRRAHSPDRVVAVMFLDLDRFKNVNDTLGHDVGDALLKSMAARLQGCLREGDSVARLGGDEFAVLLEDVASAEDVSTIAGKILDAFALPFSVHAHELFVTASIGISLYPNDGATAATLLKNADAAMYRAKDLGKNNYQFYSADMSAAAFERLTLESSLRRALERDEFVLYYQPQIDIVSGQLIGVEALLRWEHPEFGLLSPTQFIPIAEETGAIVPLGEWVARKAMEQVKEWRRDAHPELRVALNVSGRQFTEASFLDAVPRLLEETGLPPHALELEITESVLMRNAEKTVERLRTLHAMGVRFAIDDFGTGYSSLSYLRRFAIHTLKIDKSFIREMTAGSGDVEIVKTIIMMARGLKLAVIAEGVETREQLLFLKSYGCHAVQGYLVARPLTAAALSARLAQTGMRGWLP